MADQIPADMTVEQWDDKYFEDFVNKDWWKKFSGTEASNMICVKEELVDKPGNKVHLALVNELEAGALGENDLYEGNESQMTVRDFPIEVHEYGRPVKYKNWEQKKTAIDLRQVYKSGLQTWNMKLHRDKILKAMGSVYDSNGISYGFDVATEAVKDQWLTWNTDRVLFGNDQAGNLVAGDMSASLANVANTEKFTPALLDQMKYMGEHPATGKTRVRPLEPRSSVDESHGFVAFVDDLILRDIRDDSGFVQANREARLRGIENPIFRGANYIWNNVAIYGIPEINPLPGVGASGTQLGRVFLCGAQAIGVAWGKRPWTVDEKLDYGRFSGMAIMQYYEVEKLRWGTGTNDKDAPVDHGMVHGFFAAAGY
jgi:hypothetical protein